MRHDGWVLRVAAILTCLLLACDPASIDRAAPTAPPSMAAPGDLAAVEPPPPSVAAFAAEAAQACVAARAELEARPLRGDPVASQARRADVRAAVRHYRQASRVWTAAAGRLFGFGLPDDDRGQRFVSALDVLAMRSRQVVDALGGGERDAVQAALAAAEQALGHADAIARELDLGPLMHCGTVPGPLGGRTRVRVTARDFDFRVGPLTPGGTRLVVRNRGVEDHQLFVVPLREPGVLAAAIAADRRGQPLDGFLSGRGNASPVVAPGQRAVLDVDLEAGPYGFVCFVASEDGTPHAYKGMAVEVTVGS